MARLAVLGASGKTGANIVKQALEAGHDVVGLVRTPEEPTHAVAGLKVVQGDVMVAASLEPLNSGFDHLIVALGSRDLWGNTVRSEGTANVLAALSPGGDSPHVWVVSAAGVGESWNQLGWSSRFFARVLLPSVMKEHQRQEEAVRASGRPYSIVRASGLTTGDNSDYVVIDEGRLPTSKVSRLALARCIIDNLENADWINRARSVTNPPSG